MTSALAAAVVGCLVGFRVIKKSIDCIQHIFYRLMTNYSFVAEGLVIPITVSAETIFLVVCYDTEKKTLVTIPNTDNLTSWLLYRII